MIEATPIELAAGHLHAALVQRSPSDDPIIMDHIQAAYDLLKQLRDQPQKDRQS